MAKGTAFIPDKLRPWIAARRRFHLSHAHVQMARELGLNPAKLGKLAGHRQEPWKAPLPSFIADRYFLRFGRSIPDNVGSIEEIAAAEMAKRRARREAREARREAAGPDESRNEDPSPPP
jgi:hypothetical protein